jgi:hypothetical protein
VVSYSLLHTFKASLITLLNKFLHTQNSRLLNDKCFNAYYEWATYYLHQLQFWNNTKTESIHNLNYSVSTAAPLWGFLTPLFVHSYLGHVLSSSALTQLTITNFLTAPVVAWLPDAPVLFYGSVCAYRFFPEFRQVACTPTYAGLTFDLRSQILSLKL